jgi:hypothetical protein
MLFATSAMANDYHCVGIGGETSKLWQGREFVYRFLDAVDLKFIDTKTGEVIPLTLDRVYTTGNRYQAQGIHFFLTAGLISTFKPLDRGKINMSIYDRAGNLLEFARMDCVLIYK